MKILFLTTVLPSKRRGGTEIASQNFIDALQQSGHEVLVVGYQRQNAVIENNTNEISVSERYIETNQAKLHSIIWMLLSFIKNIPYSSAKYYSRIYIDKLNLILLQNKIDFVIIDHPQLGWLKNFISAKFKLILNTHNVEHELYISHFKNARNYIFKWIYKREARLIKDTENRLANTAKEVWTLTAHDRRYFSSVKKEGRVRDFAVPSSLTTLLDRPTVKNCDIGIIGSWTWKANSLGLKWFFQAVYPHLPADISIQVAGKGAEWLHGRYSNVKYCGFVPSAQAFMAQAKVIAIPSISGSGIQIKTLDAIASGASVVATPIALRGITEYPCSVSVAERPEDFANSLTQLLVPTAQDFCRDGIAWSENRRKKFFADVAEAIDAIQRELEPQLVNGSS